MRCMMSQMIYLSAEARFPQLADAETCGRMGDNEIDIADTGDHQRTAPSTTASQ